MAWAPSRLGSGPRLLGGALLLWLLGAPGACTAGRSPSPSSPGSRAISVAPTSDAAVSGASDANAGIRCGGERCDGTSEVCCADSKGNGLRCLPRPSDSSASPCQDGELTKYCDERSDCDPGAVCCRTYDCSGGCPPKLECEQTRCEVEMAEACLDEAGCGSAFECRTAPDSEQGFCGLTRPGVACGRERCEGARPVCRWDAATKSGKCVARVPDDLGEPNDIAFLACASAADCGGYACGKMAEMPYRIFQCAAPGFAGDRFSPILCTTVADCPKHWQRAATGCEPSDGLPAFARACVYPDLE